MGCRRHRIQYKRAEKGGFVKTAVHQAEKATSPDESKWMERYVGGTIRNNEVFGMFAHLEKIDS